jgi:branched-chain amino acid transport system permease protein
MELFIYGITNSVTLALIALGFSLTFGISGVANFAHGAFYLLGGILTWVFMNQIGIPYFLSALISIGMVGLFGFFYTGDLCFG